MARVHYDFVPVPETIEREIEKPALERLYRILLRFIRRGVTDPSLRQLAHAMRRGVRQVQRYINGLVELGKLLVKVRRVTGNRNNTNVYALTDLQRGVGVINDTEKRRENLKTNTPAPEARGLESKPEKSTLQLQGEMRRLQDKLDSLRMRGEYVERGKLWFELQQCRLRKAYERTRIAMGASIGVSTLPPPTEEQEREWEAAAVRYRAEEAARIAAKRLEEQRAVESRRIEQEQLEAHREGCETCKGTGFKMRVVGGVIKQLQCKHGVILEA
jgi:hypothetical protein